MICFIPGPHVAANLARTNLDLIFEEVEDYVKKSL